MRDPTRAAAAPGGTAAPGSVAGRPTVIRPPGRWPTLALREAWDSRGICLVLARRSIKIRYRQSAVGIDWVVLQPLLLAAVFTVFFSVMARSSGDVPYPVFFLAGLIVWQLTAKILGEGTNSVAANSALVTRVYLPRSYFPVSVVLASLVDLAFTGLALLGVMALFGLVPEPTVVLVPALVAVAAATALGAAFWLSALSVTYRDVIVILPVLTQVWFFASPVLYSIDVVPPELLGIYYLNPLALVVTGMRWSVLGLPAPPAEAWVAGISVAALLLVSGYLVFRQREPTFADVI